MKKLKIFQRKFPSAFSLIELAIVGLIISVLMAGILGSSALKKRAVLANARTITNSSPVADIGDLALWYESTSEKSFSADEAVDGSSVSTWYDINPNIETVRNNATQTTAGNRPTYKTNKINGLPAISFTRANSNFLAFDGTSLANSNYTIFVVEQRTSNDTSNTFIGGTSATTNSNLSFAYQTESMTIDQYNNTLTANVFLTYSTPTPRIHTFSFNFSTKKYYVNGIEVVLTGSGTSYNIAQSLAAFPGAALGANRISGLEKYFQGDIGEVIIFKKSLNIEDRKSVEKYLGKKWSITVSSSSSTCNGIITNNGCETSCPVSIVGVLTPTSVAGGTSGTFICTTPQYNDTIPYTCSAFGVLDIGGHACDVCNTAGGYTFYNGICQGQCTPSSIAGIVSPSPVNAGAATITCNDTANHFSTTDTVSGICNAGVFTPNSGQACGCASGYELNSSGICIAGCTGGDNIYSITVGATSYKVHEFTTVTADPVNNPNTFSCGDPKTVEVLVVGGGGGGGGGAVGTGGSGGGAGRVIYNNSVSVSAGDTAVIVGDGGIGGTAVRGCTGSGSNGSLSKFGAISASGGGGGGGRECNGKSGGSGGGAGAAGWVSIAGAGETGGYAGGVNSKFSYNASIGFGAGGGGGSSSFGGNGLHNKGGNGGSGSVYNITGTDKAYGGGGAASLKCSTGCTSYYGTAGTGGGGGVNNAGQSNTGGGGGGGGIQTDSGRKGGSGIVIIRYQYP